MPDLPLDTLLILLLVLASLVGRLFQRKGGEEEAPPAPHTESERWREEDEDYEPEERYAYEEEAPEEEKPKRRAFDLGEVLRDLQEQVTAATQPPVPPPPPREETFVPPPPRRTAAAATNEETFDQAAHRRLREARQRVKAGHVDTTSASRPSSAALFAASIVRDLREPQSLRKAIVLREVLGPPVSMRNPSHSDHP